PTVVALRRHQDERAPVPGHAGSRGTGARGDRRARAASGPADPRPPRARSLEAHSIGRGARSETLGAGGGSHRRSHRLRALTRPGDGGGNRPRLGRKLELSEPAVAPEGPRPLRDQRTVLRAPRAIEDQHRSLSAETRSLTGCTA